MIIRKIKIYISGAQKRQKEEDIAYYSQLATKYQIILDAMT